MKTGIIILVIVAALAGAFMVYFTDVNQTREGQMPTVDVNVEEGQMPAYEAEMGDISLEEKTVEMEVPTGISITPPEDEETPNGQ